MKRISSHASEKFSIDGVLHEDRIGISVFGVENHSSLMRRLVAKLANDNFSIDMCVVHRKGEKLRVSLLLDRVGNLRVERGQIRSSLERIAGERGNVLIHGELTKITVFGRGLCTSPLTSKQIFDKIGKAGQNIEMMSISENEINLVFPKSTRLETMVPKIAALAKK